MDSARLVCSLCEWTVRIDDPAVLRALGVRDDVDRVEAPCPRCAARLGWDEVPTEHRVERVE